MHNFTTIPSIMLYFFKAKSYADETYIASSNPPPKQSTVWNGMENGMEWNGTEISLLIMEDARMEWKISRMERKTIFHKLRIYNSTN